MKVMSIVGARPQFIKAAAVSQAIDEYNDVQDNDRLNATLVHTGQHYDYEMSSVFFEELSLPKPHNYLGVGSGTHAFQTGHMLMRIEEIIVSQEPDIVLVYGDTNTTLAGALAAAKLHTCLAHIEAGLRSFNRRMPEEINRVACDHMSDLLFCPSMTAIENLENEGIRDGVSLVGDVMQDVLIGCRGLLERRSDILQKFDVLPGDYALATIHRAGNTASADILQSILHGLSMVASSGLPVLMPAHPRVQNALDQLEIALGQVRVVPPASYLEMVSLQANARVILTDSGGVQKEAYWLGVPCVTLRDETEWTETLEAGWNQLAGSEPDQILKLALREAPTERPSLYGDGRAANKIVNHLVSFERELDKKR